MLIHRDHTVEETATLGGQAVGTEEFLGAAEVLFDGLAGDNEKSTCVSLRRLFVPNIVAPLCVLAC